jgi:hypothetical protein
MDDARRPPTSLRRREDLIKLAAAQPVTSLPASSASNVDKRARIALSWFDNAQLTDDRGDAVPVLRPGGDPRRQE